MGWWTNMNENMKRGIRSWLNIVPANGNNIQINEALDFETHAIRNRIWYRGDSNELEQMYGQMAEYADKYKFWASKCTPGMEMRKIHTGLPGLIVRILSGIILEDMNDFKFNKPAQENLWKEIEKENKFRKSLEKALKEVLYIGDGAFKVTINTAVSQYPILEWYPGERIEIIKEYGRLKEVVFKSLYKEDGKSYTLHEYYGYGYIHNELYYENTKVDMKTVKATKDISDYAFDASVILAVPLKIYESAKFEGRGGSIFDGKLDSFDAFDETWSQWMDALRSGRARTYIPESYIPRNPETGELMKASPFDNRFIAGDNNMDENGKNQIVTEQPTIPHESYLASYCTALDLCLQGIISPSTLGIDVKKLDNAEAQREKEKATLYTRSVIVEALQEELPQVISACINAHNILNKEPIEEIEVDIPFGEYANPSFESQVETITKGKQGGIMSIEAAVEELYGDSKDEAWKKEEVTRLKAEQGIADVENPGINMVAGGFQVDMKGGISGEGQGNEPYIPDEPKGVPGVIAGGQ